MTNGVYELMDVDPQSENSQADNPQYNPQMGGSLPPEPEVESALVRFVTRATYWRIWALVGGIFAAIVAFYIFYFQPWLGYTSRWDVWLERNRCIFRNLCTAGDPTANFAIPHHVGLLALFAALLLLGITLQKSVDLWFPEQRSIRRFNPNYIPFFITLGSLCIGYQIYQLLINQSTPGVVPWLLGLLFFAWAALLWDSRETDSVSYTVANLLLAAGSVLLIIGAAAVATGSMSAAILLAVGGALFLWGNLQASQLDSHFELIDYIIMLGLALLALFLGLMRVWDWQYTFIGDEWGFFTLAQELIHKPLELPYFYTHDSNGYHTVFSSALQSTIMRLAGENVFGWRLSSLLPMVFSVPALYIFLRWATRGRNAATLGAGLLAVSHVLLSFSMVGYNNTQALLPLTLGLGAFAFAQYHFSALRYLLLGIVLGSSFLLFGLGRLALIPLALLIIIYVRSSLQRMTLARLFVILGFIGAAAPTLFNLGNWQALLKATPMESEAGSSASAQVVQNIVAGLQAFLTSDHNTHFVVGPHLDPFTAFLMIIGIGYILFTFLRNPRTLGWLVAALLFWVAVSSIQQYTHVANTRMFILIPIYASLAGIGGAMLIQQLIAPNYPRVQLLFVGLMLAIGAGLNQLHIQDVALSTIRWKPEAILVQQLQKSEAANGGGMPTYVVWDEFPNPLENTIVSAYNVGPERVRFINAEEALSVAAICKDDPTTPKMLLLRANHRQAGEIDRHIRSCWPDITISGIHNEVDERTFYRYLNRPGVQQMALSVEQRTSYRLYPEYLAVGQPKGIVLDDLGDLYALSTERTLLSSKPTVIHFAPDGSVKNRLSLAQDNPQAIEITPDGLLLVAAKDEGAGLVWYDTQGHPLRTSQVDLGEIDDLEINSSGQIFASSPGRSLIYQLSSQGRIEQEYTGEGRLQRPSALAMGADDASIWVLNTDENNLLELSPADTVLGELPLPSAIVDHGVDFTVEPSGTILLAQAVSQRVIRLDRAGALLNIWDGFKRPTGLATNYTSRLYVMDPDMGQVNIISLSADAQPTEPASSPISPLPTLAPESTEVSPEDVAEDVAEQDTEEIVEDVDAGDVLTPTVESLLSDEDVEADPSSEDQETPVAEEADPQNLESLADPDTDSSASDDTLVDDPTVDEELPATEENVEDLETPVAEEVNSETDPLASDDALVDDPTVDEELPATEEEEVPLSDDNVQEDPNVEDLETPVAEEMDSQSPESLADPETDPSASDDTPADEGLVDDPLFDEEFPAEGPSDEVGPSATEEDILVSDEESDEVADEYNDDQPESPLLTDDQRGDLSQPISPLEPGE